MKMLDEGHHHLSRTSFRGDSPPSTFYSSYDYSEQSYVVFLDPGSTIYAGSLQKCNGTYSSPKPTLPPIFIKIRPMVLAQSC